MTVHSNEKKPMSYSGRFCWYWQITFYESLKSVDVEEINIHQPQQNIDQSDDRFFVVWDSTIGKLGTVRYWMAGKWNLQNKYSLLWKKVNLQILLHVEVNNSR